MIKSHGFTLIELLIVIAILGVLAAVGVPMFNDYNIASKENAAKNNLQSIAFMQGENRRESGQYFPCPRSKINTSQIDKEFFGNKGELLSTGYAYEIDGGCNDFEAFAIASNPKAQCFKIDSKSNIKTTPCSKSSESTPELPPGVKMCPDSGCDGPYTVYVSDPCQNPYSGGHNPELVKYFCDLIQANPDGVTCNNPHASRDSSWKGRVKKDREGCPLS